MEHLNDNGPQKFLTLYFQVHQPRRLNHMNFLQVGSHPEYFDDALNSAIIRRAASCCYLPVNKMLTELAKKHKNVRLTFSISGVALRQFEMFAPDVLDSFKKLHDTGCVEILGETSHHSLAGLMPNDEFTEQVRAHTELIQHHFHTSPLVFRNTELIYSNSIGSRIAGLGFKGTICDGIDRLLRGRNTYNVYRHPLHRNFKLLIRSNSLSDDIGFRFTANGGLNINQYIGWLESAPGPVTIGLDYETFGEHVHEGTGIIGFLHNLIDRTATSPKLRMATPSEVFAQTEVDTLLDVPDLVSWADQQKDISAWLESDLQKEALHSLLKLEEDVRLSRDQQLLDVWRNLQTSDHFYYMSTKAAGDGDVHAYFSHYDSPYSAYINYMNVLTDLRLRLKSVPRSDQMEVLEFERRHELPPVWAERRQAEFIDATTR